MKNVYLKLTTPDLKGESMDKDHGQWLELDAISHQMHQPGSPSISTAGGHTAGRAEHGDMTVTKEIDSASPMIYQALSSGTTFQSAQIDVYRAAGDGLRIKYLEISLKHVLISRVAFSIDGGPLPLESLSLRYAAIQWKYVKQHIDGGQAGITQGAWSLTKNDKTFAA